MPDHALESIINLQRIISNALPLHIDICERERLHEDGRERARFLTLCVCDEDRLLEFPNICSVTPVFELATSSALA